MSRLARKATDVLSAGAQRLMVAGFRDRKPYRVIAAELATIGEPVPERTIARRASEFRMGECRREALRCLLGEAARGDFFGEAVEAISNLDLFEGFLARSRARVRAVVTDYLRAPNPEIRRVLRRQLLIFELGWLVLRSQRDARPSDRLEGDNDDVAGEPGGGLHANSN